MLNGDLTKERSFAQVGFWVDKHTLDNSFPHPNLPFSIVSSIYSIINSIRFKMNMCRIEICLWLVWDQNVGILLYLIQIIGAYVYLPLDVPSDQAELLAACSVCSEGTVINIQEITSFLSPSPVTLQHWYTSGIRTLLVTNWWWLAW